MALFFPEENEEAVPSHLNRTRAPLKPGSELGVTLTCRVHEAD